MPPKPLSTEDKAVLKKVGERLKYFRKKAGYTNYDAFAYENNIHRSQYGQYENGKNLTIPTLSRLLKALGVTFEEFFKDFE